MRENAPTSEEPGIAPSLTDVVGLTGNPLQWSNARSSSGAVPRIARCKAEAMRGGRENARAGSQAMRGRAATRGGLTGAMNQQHVIEMESEEDAQPTGTADEHYNVVSVLYHALQGAEVYEEYAEDAEGAGDEELAEFFNELQDEERRRADRAKWLVVSRMSRKAA